MPLGWMADYKQLVWGAGEWRGIPLVVGAILIAMDYDGLPFQKLTLTVFLCPGDLPYGFISSSRDGREYME
jgi:hypothetical protein